MSQAAADLAVLSPARLGSLTLRNRISFNSTVCMIGRDHAFDEERIAYYTERAKGGVGLVITEGLSVHPTSVPTPTVPIAHDARNIENFAALAGSVHAHGAAIFGQLWHVGRQSLWSPFQTPWSASGQRDPLSGTTPHAMTEAEIAELLEHYVRSARNLQAAGFDGAEIHCAHGYLPQQFLSPWSNWREDRWGGSRENRARFLAEIIRRIRDVVRPDFALGVKLAAHEYVDGGIDLDESRLIVAHLQQVAPVDFIEVSVANFSPSLERHVPDMRFADVPFAELAAGIKDVAGSAAVMAIAKIPDIEAAEALVRSGKADFAGMVRALIADPHLVAKARRGEKARPCVYCNACWDMTHQLKAVTCFYAPVVERAVAPASQARTVRVIGGGPAGLEFARIAAEAGHHVFLYEKSAACGGRVRRDAMVPGRERMGEVAQWLTVQARRAGVEIVADCEITPALAAQWPAEDLIVQATGAAPAPQILPGDELRLTLEEVALDPTLAHGAVTLIDEIDDEPVYALAEMLAGRGHVVRIMTRRPVIGRRVPHVNMIGAFRRLDMVGVEIHAGLVPERLEGGVLHVRHGLSGRAIELGPTDTVIHAGPYAATPSPTGARRPDLVIGDAYAPRTLLAAMRHAHDTAHALEAGLDPAAGRPGEQAGHLMQASE